MGGFTDQSLLKKDFHEGDEEQIVKFGEQVAMFHKACHSIRNTLPVSSKTLKTDVDHLLRLLETDYGRYEYRNACIDQIKSKAIYL